MYACIHVYILKLVLGVWGVACVYTCASQRRIVEGRERRRAGEWERKRERKREGDREGERERGRD